MKLHDLRAPGRSRHLRAFGTITHSSEDLGSVALDIFTCADAGKALILLHKLGRDMAQTATAPVKWVWIASLGNLAMALVRDGIGTMLPAAIGSTVLVFSSAKTRDLDRVFSSAASRLQGASFFDSAFRYPVFIDKFSDGGLGSWYIPYMDEPQAGGRMTLMDEHLNYARENSIALQPHAGDFLLRNYMPKFREYGVAYRFAEWMEWSQDLARMATDELVLPGNTFTSMPHYYGQISEGGQRLLQYRNWKFQNVMKEHVDNPLLIDWVDPNGELGPHYNYPYWDYSESNRQNMVRYLREQRQYTLQSLGEAWFGDAARFRSWDEVAIPMDHSLFGLGEGDILAGRSWRMHPSFSPRPDTAESETEVWALVDRATLPNDLPRYVREGLERGFHKAEFDDSGWAEFSLPGGEFGAIHWNVEGGWGGRSYWWRGSVYVTQEWLRRAQSSGPIYLTVAALNQSNGWKHPDRVWINGIETACVSTCPGGPVIAQLDVSDLIKPGRNVISYLATATLYSNFGPFFLTTRKMQSYPFADAHLNARYHDWHQYIGWSVIEKAEQTYKVLRAIDPDRLIKMQAARDKSLSIPLAARYGCFPHVTGEGSSYYPWNKRCGYVYGLPASGEFPASILEPEAWKRWLGFFWSEGLNALDNFITIQAMMYTPVSELWRKYMPYIRLAGRREIRKPDLALFFSSQNSLLLPRPVPLCFDIGRGDLQFIGWSCVYVDEAAVRNGLLNDYPVIWDTGTWIMDPATVAGLKKYVEEGGTFIAIHETGRHTFTHRDAWPITDLTGYKTGQERPMTGTVHILAEQTLFTKLAGRNFCNCGRSIDYSNHNYADKCFALEPVAPDTRALARYSDGTIAIGMRTLGKGRVITLASPFWRDSQDKRGMWWPGPGQCDFLEDLLNALNVAPVARSESRDIWREHYLANNGTEEYLSLFNPFDTPRTFNIEWHTLRPTVKLFDPKNGEEIDGEVSGTTIKLHAVTLDGLETKIVAAQSQRSARDALSAWFDQLSLWWRPSEAGQTVSRPDLPCYTIQLATTMKGRIVHTSDILTADPAELSRKADPGDGFELGVGQSAEIFRNQPDPDRRALLHCPLNLPHEWTDKDRIELMISRFAIPGDDESADIVDAYVNGTRVIAQAHSAAPGHQGLGGGAMADGAVADISGLINFNGVNSLCVVAGEYGFVGEIKIRRHPASAESMQVTGAFKVQCDADSGVGMANIPGIVKGLYAWTDDLIIPATWKGSRVFIDIDVANLSEYDSFAINDKVVFHPVNWPWFRPVTWMDITPWVKFGIANKLALISKQATRRWLPGRPDYRSITLLRVDVR